MPGHVRRAVAMSDKVKKERLPLSLKKKAARKEQKQSCNLMQSSTSSGSCCSVAHPHGQDSKSSVDSATPSRVSGK